MVHLNWSVGDTSSPVGEWRWKGLEHKLRCLNIVHESASQMGNRNLFSRDQFLYEKLHTAMTHHKLSFHVLKDS